MSIPSFSQDQHNNEPDTQGCSTIIVFLLGLLAVRMLIAAGSISRLADGRCSR